MRHNSALNGAAVYTTPDTFLELTRVNGSYNSAVNNGGVVHASGSVSVHRSVFENNKAQVSGGVISIKDASHPCSVLQSNFSNNTAGSSGGAMQLVSSRCTVAGSSFKLNSAVFGGAMVHSGGDLERNSSLYITKTSFQGSEALGMGGVLSADGGSSTNISNCVINGSIARVGGGAFDIRDGVYLGLADTVVSYCKSILGGGLFLQSFSNTVVLTDRTLFFKNKADRGGVFFSVCDATCLVILRDSMMHSNSAPQGASALPSVCSATVIIVGTGTGGAMEIAGYHLLVTR